MQKSIPEMMSVIPLPAWQTHDWLLHKHYAKRIPSISYAFGLYCSGNGLQGVCTFGKPASPFLCVGICGRDSSDLVYELNRLVVNDSCPKNTASYFVSKSLNALPGGLIIVSYADIGMGHIGKVYQSTNWLYTGATKERTDIGVDDNSHSRHYDKGLDYSLNRKLRTSKHRYVYFTGNKKEKRDNRENLNYKVLPYPKGDTRRYDASYNPDIQQTLFT